MQITPITDAAIQRAADCLRGGGLVAFPTETVYGLGALASDDKAVARIFAAKNRPSFNPLISHFASPDAALSAGIPSLQAQQLAQVFMPGPLTLILTRSKGCGISALASAGTDSLAVRVPVHAQAQALLTAINAPIVAPSANPSGRISPTTAEHVLAGLGTGCDMILDGGPCQSGIESTVIDCRNETLLLLRPGPITAEQIKEKTGLSVRLPARKASAADPLVAPGQLASHYAPTAAVRLNAADRQPGEIFVGFGPPPQGITADFTLSSTGCVIEAAANLFSVLHEADRLARNAIAFAPVPMSGLGQAINDRLMRAAAPR